MSYRVEINNDTFDREFRRLHKKFRSLKQDVDCLIGKLETNPFIGADLGGGVRKVRLAIGSKGKGKSHGARVITYTTAIVNIDEEGIVTLVYIYDKGERDSLTSSEIEALLKTLR